MNSEEIRNKFSKIEDTLDEILSIVEVTMHSCENKEYFAEADTLKYAHNQLKELISSAFDFEI